MPTTIKRISLLKSKSSLIRTCPYDLTRAVARGDKIAETQLIQLYRNRIFGLLRKMTYDTAYAEDLTHETLIIALQKLRNNELRDPLKLQSYLFQIAKFTYLGWSRKNANRMALSGYLESFAELDQDIEHEITQPERRQFLLQALASLSMERDRDILYRYYFMEQSKYEICDTLSISLQHFHRVISRARQRLKSRIEISYDIAAG